MAKSSSAYICQQCGFRSQQFLGKCPQCGTWNSLVETIEQPSNLVKKSLNTSKIKSEIVNIANLEKTDYDRLNTSLREFDRVLGGGIVFGSLILVSGDPGIGKSTLLTQLAININSQKNSSVLYVAGEESARQIKLRVDRIKPAAGLLVLNEVDVDLIIEAVRVQKPQLVIVDSIQTLQTQDLESVAGSISQVRESAARLQQAAKSLHIPIFLVGHVTKDGNIAGPKTLEHVVDVVLSLEGEPNSNFRILRTTKNRFGPTDEIGIFEMEESGLIEVDNPSKVFINSRINAPGSVVIPTVNGLRPMLVEIQALVTKSQLPIPRRIGTGIDNNRLQLLVAVLSKRLKLSLFDQDIFVNVTGGMKVLEPAADLGICIAIISSFKDLPTTPKTVFIGEVGLLGELRFVRSTDKRAIEAKKLGYIQVVSPDNTKSLDQAVQKAFK